MAFWKPGAARPEPLSLEVDRGAEGGRLVTYNRDENLALAAQRSRLPIFKCRDAILFLVETRATTVLVGQTGCGKTTQVPQYLAEAGWCAGGRMVACTQPRRVAAQTIAARVAEEMGTPLGRDVGYAVRFESVCTPGVTKIVFCTDGVLLRELMDDPLLTKYGVVMVDEAHERSLASDALLGLLKKIQRRRPDLRVVIASATIQAETFAEFFDTRDVPLKPALGPAALAPGARVPSREPGIVSVEGRAHSVAIHYLAKPAPEYVKAAVATALDVHRSEGPGDVLVFLTGEDEIEEACEMLRDSWEEETRAASGRRTSGATERASGNDERAGTNARRAFERVFRNPFASRRVSPVRGSASGGADGGVRARAAVRAQGGRSFERRRDLRYDRGRGVRHRLPVREEEELRRLPRRGEPSGGARLARRRQSARRARRAFKAGQVFPALHGTGFRSFAGTGDAGDVTFGPRFAGAAAQAPGHRQHRALRVAQSPPRREHAQGD
jgi:ATP-dependent RNA helicase DDX35